MRLPSDTSANLPPLLDVEVAMAADTKQKPNEASEPKNYKGFVAGVFSGVAKLSGMYISSTPSSPEPQQHGTDVGNFGLQLATRLIPVSDMQPPNLPSSAAFSRPKQQQQ